MTLTREQIEDMSQQQLRQEIARLINHSDYDPDYSNDIVIAWKLVEEMNRHCWTVNVQFEAGGITVFVTERGAVSNQSKKIWEFGDTAPIAICRAWLIWSEEVGG